MTELVYIGIDVQKDDMIHSLDQCLLREEEMELDWSEFHDPLPEWPQQQQSFVLAIEKIVETVQERK
jgi:hypothetical protein